MLVPLKDENHLSVYKGWRFIHFVSEFLKLATLMFLCVPRIVPKIATMLETWGLARVGMKMFASKVVHHYLHLLQTDLRANILVMYIYINV